MQRLILSVAVYFSLAVSALAQVCPAGSTCATLDSYLGAHLVLGGALTTTGTGAATFALGNSTGTYTFQGTDTYVGRATTDTLTNKTLTSPTINGAALSGTISGSATWTGGQAVTPTAGGTQGGGGTLTPDFSASNSVTATFGAGNLTIANPTNVKAGQNYIIALTQDGVGSRTVTWGGNFKWAGATAPTLSTTASAKDVISCWADTTTTINCTLAVKGAS